MVTKGRRATKKAPSNGLDSSVVELSEDAIVERVLKQRRLLCEEKHWVTECIDTIAGALGAESTTTVVRCRGIGCVGRSDIAQVQCAFALLLHERWGGQAPEFCEPLIEGAERTAIERLGFVIHTSIRDADECDDGAMELLYMPHCPAGLYHEEIRLRWSQHALNRLVIVGNSFENYWLRLPPKKAPLLRKCEPLVTQINLPNAPFAKTAFNDTSVMSFAVTDALEPLKESEVKHNDPELRT